MGGINDLLFSLCFDVTFWELSLYTLEKLTNLNPLRTWSCFYFKFQDNCSILLCMLKTNYCNSLLFDLLLQFSLKAKNNIFYIIANSGVKGF